MLELMQEYTTVLPFLQNLLFLLFEEFPTDMERDGPDIVLNFRARTGWNFLARQFVFCSSRKENGPF